VQNVSRSATSCCSILVALRAGVTTSFEFFFLHEVICLFLPTTANSSANSERPNMEKNDDD